MSADPAIMEFLMPLQREKALGEWIDNQINPMQAHGFCFWEVERKEDGILIGTVGLRKVGYEALFTPAVEIGWRIARPFWGLGYAPEACLQFGFDALALSEIIAITVPSNPKSRRVMSKIGMIHNPTEDFDHPLFPNNYPLRRHVFYRLLCDQWVG